LEQTSVLIREQSQRDGGKKVATATGTQPALANSAPVQEIARMRLSNLRPICSISGKNFLFQMPTLIAGDWTLEPGTEAYYCVRQTVAEDTWIGAFRPSSSAGTHHGTLSFSDSVEPVSFSRSLGGLEIVPGLRGIAR
jgi:hypothetical protein